MKKTDEMTISLLDRPAAEIVQDHGRECCHLRILLQKIFKGYTEKSTKCLEMSYLSIW